ncbi:MAG: sensor histidine kinase [Chthoniobacterales bacterium]
MNFIASLQRQRPFFIFCEALALVLIIGFFDLATGYEVSLSILYGIPIFLVAWCIDKDSGILVALISGIVWWWASVEGGQPYLNNWMEVWETCVRIAFFIFIAIGAASLKRERDAAEARIALLEHSQRLENEIIEISEREQRRIGRDLHDGLCQYQAALACAAVSLQTDLLAKELPNEAKRAGELAQRLQEAIGQTRDLARGLVPVQMEDAGLPSALEELARSVSDLHSVQCRFEMLGSPPVIQNGAATHLYRIAQEAINNATRHGHAQNIEVSLLENGTGNILCIRDDGAGLSKTSTGSGGMGLNIMSYRAKIAGGQLQIEEPPEGGTTVSCILSAGNLEEELDERAA